MEQVDAHSTRRKAVWATLAIAAVTSASAVTIALPATSNADPEPAPRRPRPRRRLRPRRAPRLRPHLRRRPPRPHHRRPPRRRMPQPGPGDPNATPPPPADPNAPPPPVVDPNAGRITNAVGGFSFVIPAGWVESDASHLDYGSALLSKSTGPAADARAAAAGCQRHPRRAGPAGPEALRQCRTRQRQGRGPARLGHG